MKVYRYFYKFKKYQLILLGIFLPLIIVFLIAVIFNCLGITDDTDEEQFKSTIAVVVAMITVGPLIETLFLQYLPLKIGHYLFKRYKYHYCVIILLSATIFALTHPQEIFYFTAMLFAGLVWSFICLIFIRNKQHPLLYTAISHAGYNSIIIMVRVTILHSNLIT